MAEWAWDGDDFAALWFSDARDRIPNLLRYTSRFPYRSEVDRHRAQVARRYDLDETERIELAMHTLQTSDMRIEIFGSTTKYKGSTGSDRAYRIIGGRNTYHAAILYQTTEGETDGRIRLRMCRPGDLPAQLVATVFPCEPGSQQQITVHPNDIRNPRRSQTGNTPPERYQRLMSTLHGAGSGQLRVGAFNTYPEPANMLQWFDAADGRYVEIRSENITLRPAAPQDLAARFGAWMDNILKRLREDEYERW